MKNGGKFERDIVLTYLRLYGPQSTKERWFTANILSVELGMPQRKVICILRNLYALQLIERRTQFGYAHRWKARPWEGMVG
jgi:hypothetical protein